MKKVNNILKVFHILFVKISLNSWLKKCCILTFIILIFGIGIIYSQPGFVIEILSVNDVINNIQKKFNEIETMRADFNIINKTEGLTRISKGQLKFKKPSNFIMNFKKPKDQVLFYNGERLKIFIPSLRILGEQRLSIEEQSTFFIQTRTAFYQLKKNYNFSFEYSNKPKKIFGQDMYTLVLDPKEAMVGFKKMRLWINTNWVIMKAEGITYTGNIISISLSSIEINVEIEDGEFELKLPVNVQTIYNPLLTIEQEE